MQTFLQRLEQTSQTQHSLLCVGLDPIPTQLPTGVRMASDPVYVFCTQIIEATADIVCAFKPNIAFFEALGPTGFETLQRIIQAIPDHIPVILDAKRGDIGSTATAYAHAIFDLLGADAVTLNPYLGGDTLQPFLQYQDRGCILLCKTSNPGSADIQNLCLTDGRPLYLEVARQARDVWNMAQNVGLVVGATYPTIIEEIRGFCPDLPFLIPGVGTQGGDIAATVQAAVTPEHQRAIISVSRDVLYASSEDTFAEAARNKALEFRNAINDALI
ncbi:MAG: orotidine-5'-phosphate decarboxylase [Chloroflexota bacterium]